MFNTVLEKPMDVYLANAASLINKRSLLIRRLKLFKNPLTLKTLSVTDLGSSSRPNLKCSQNLLINRTGQEKSELKRLSMTEKRSTGSRKSASERLNASRG